MGYPQKEIIIYEGVARLVASGKDLHRIKVADIAEAAGIGKGTVYEYFSSKDEILQKTLLYCISVGLERAKISMEAAQGFERQFYALLDVVDQSVKIFPTLQLLLALASADSLQSLCDTGMLRGKLDEGYALMDRLVECGRQDGVIACKEGAHYTRMAVHAALSGYLAFLLHEGKDRSPSAHQAKEYAFHLLQKSLS